MARLRSQFRDAAKQRYKHCSTGQEGLGDVIESLLEISLRIHEQLVSNIRSCIVVYLLVVSIHLDSVCLCHVCLHSSGKLTILGA